LSLGLSLTFFSVLLYITLSRTLSSHHDEELSEQAISLADVLAGGPLNESRIADALAGSHAASRLVMLRDSKGDLLYRSPVLEFAEPNIGKHEVLVHTAAGGVRERQFFTVTLEHTGPVRFVCIPLDTSTSVYLQLGNPLGDVPSTLRAVLFACIGIVPLVLVVTSFGGWMIARRALAPMHAIDRTLQAIQATDLSKRIDVDAGDQELTQLITTLNRLLDRLDLAFRDLRQFAGDVSHQLQTPLTVMQSSVDAALQEPHEPAAGALADLAAEIGDMSAVVAGLGDLAMADAPTAHHRFDLSDATQEAVEIISALAEQKQVTVTPRIAPDVIVNGDKLRLKQIALNLGDNAVKYTPPGGHVTIDLSREGGQAVLRVGDTGIGIAPAHLAHIFERFYRVDTCRGRAGGTGLGLAIAKRIAEIHGGTIMVDSRPGAGSTFTVTLPLAGDTESAKRHVRSNSK